GAGVGVCAGGAVVAADGGAVPHRSGVPADLRGEPAGSFDDRAVPEGFRRGGGGVLHRGADLVRAAGDGAVGDGVAGWDQGRGVGVEGGEPGRGQAAGAGGGGGGGARGGGCGRRLAVWRGPAGGGGAAGGVV